MRKSIAIILSAQTPSILVRELVKHHDAGRYRPGVLDGDSLGWADTNVAATYSLTLLFRVRRCFRRLAHCRRC